MSSFCENTEYVVESCFNCGLKFAMEKSFRDTLLRTKRDFYCPNGHKQHYISKTECEIKIEKLSEELKYERNRKSEIYREQNDYNRKLNYRIRHYKGDVTKLRKKLNGISGKEK